jgi:hypothetical protein
MAAAQAAQIVDPHLESGPELLGSGSRTVSEESCQASPVGDSLAVIEPDGLQLEHEQVSWRTGSRVWARFRLSGWHYGFTISDYVVRPKLLQQPFGRYSLSQLGFATPARTVLTVSLSDAFDGRHYKLVAAIFGLA